jgi:hypothetical protein
MTPKTYTDDINLIKDAHPKLNQITTRGWWRGFRMQRGER